MFYKKNLFCVLVFLCLSVASTAQSIADFPWLNDVIDEQNCCYNQKVTVLKYDELTFLYVENNADCAIGGKLYAEDGTCWCKGDAGIDCLGFYSRCIAAGPTGCTAYEGLDRTNSVVIYDCTVGGALTVFDRFAWLKDVADPNDCCQNKTIAVYEQQGATFDSGNPVYVHIVADPTCFDGIGTLYGGDGFELCTDMPNFDCLEAYGISSREQISEWGCGN